jgi:hypothetical protein
MVLGCRHCSEHYSRCDCPASVQRAEPIVALHNSTTTIRSTHNATRMRLLRLICDNASWDRLVELAEHRAGSIGAQQYGDASYRKTSAELEAEGDDEIADWIFYAGVIEERAL